jgi:hypothetical protein
MEWIQPMTTVNKTALDRLLSQHPVACKVQAVTIAPEELVHVVGAQEPVRDQPDDRARMLLSIHWLKIENIRPELPESERSNFVSTLQQAARAWLKQPGDAASPADREQVRWMVEKTRSRESNQQIVQRVWLAAVLHSLGHRGLAFDSEGQIHWDGGITARIGLSPDAILDLARANGTLQTYTASFRQPDGTITRGKGRHRWHIYRLTIDPAANPLFERRAKQVQEKVALIVASETYATQPLLPRDFYGGDEFQQACIDAQDQQFDYILVLSPEHGVISLDDVVPSEQPWGDILERRIWAWQMLATQRLGLYLFGEPRIEAPAARDANWWAWINPESTYEFTVFGGGFAIRILLDSLVRSRTRAPDRWPKIVLMEQRPGYNVGDFDDYSDLEFEPDDESGEDIDQDFETALQDIDQLLEWASEFVSLVNVFVPPTGETWELAPDEALIPVRLLSDMGMDIEDLLDLLTDISLLLDRSLPISMVINANMVVSALLQVTHSLVHHELDAVQDAIDTFPEGVLRQYVENTLQETNLEDQLCACLTLAEQMHLMAISIPQEVSDQLLVWLQTYLSARMRQRILGSPEGSQPLEA